VPAEKAYAPMETLDVFCDACLLEKLKPCEGCGSLIYASAYQHLPTGRVLCEPCVLNKISS
jgi:formylmethanofuran dehydrogenase subunit E